LKGIGEFEGVGILRFAQDDGVKQATAKANTGVLPLRQAQGQDDRVTTNNSNSNSNGNSNGNGNGRASSVAAAAMVTANGCKELLRQR
jgi:hypothetical protein